MNENEGIIFVHIPKCGGMSIHKAIGNDLLSGDYISGLAMQKSQSQFRGVGGHFRYGNHPKGLLKKGVQYHTITTFRNPVDRLVSMYKFVITHKKSHYLLDLASEHNLKIRDFSLSDFVHFLEEFNITELSNLQTKMICRSDTCLSSNKVMRILEENIEVWGTVEKLDVFFEKLSERFQTPIKAQHRNKSEAHKISPNERTLIENFNEIDLNLWEKIQKKQ